MNQTQTWTGIQGLPAWWADQRIPLLKQDPPIWVVTYNVILSLDPIPSNIFILYRHMALKAIFFYCVAFKKISCFRLRFCRNAKGNSSNDILIDVKECTVLIHSSSDNLCSFLISTSAPSAVATWFPTWVTHCHNVTQIPELLTFAFWPLHFLPWECTLFGFWPKLSSLAGTNEYLGQRRKNSSSHLYLFWNLCTSARPAVQLKE